jgi:lipopolysaccharide export system protein LptA
VKKLPILGSILILLICGAEAQQNRTSSPTPSASVKGSKQTGKNKSAEPKSSSSPAAKGTPSNLFEGGSGDERQKGPTEITAKDQAQFDSRGRVATFYGAVKVVDPQFTMTADKLIAYMNRDEEGGGLREADAQGNVIIVHVNQPKGAGTPAPDVQPAGQPPGAPSPGGATPALPSGTPVPAGSPPQANGSPAPAQTPVRSTSKSDRAVYFTKDGTITLTGWPQVTQGVNTHIATQPNVKMIIYNDGRLQTFGSTRTVIQDRSQTGKQNATNVLH